MLLTVSCRLIFVWPGFCFLWLCSIIINKSAGQITWHPVTQFQLFSTFGRIDRSDNIFKFIAFHKLFRSLNVECLCIALIYILLRNIYILNYKMIEGYFFSVWT